MIKIIKRLFISCFILFGYNLIAVNFNMIIPFNLFSILFICFFGAPGLFALILFKTIFLQVIIMKKSNFINAVNNIISNNKLSHAYIIELNNYDDDYKLVFDFIKLILCNNKENKFDNLNCGSCNICYLIDNGNYPDIKIVETDTNAIRKEQIIQLQDDFKNKSLLDNKRVYVIKEAEKLNLASSNTLLKFIEEPEPDIIAILLTKNRYKLLDTIISRCQILKIDDTNFSDIKLDDYDIRFFECIFNKSLFTNYNFILNNIFIDKNSTFIRFNNFITYFIKYLKEDSCFDDL